MVTHKELYSELETILPELKAALKGKTKVKNKRYVEELLNIASVKEHYHLKASDDTDDKGFFGYLENKEDGLSSIDKYIIYLNSNIPISPYFHNSLYQGVAHELSHVMVGEHREKRIGELETLITFYGSTRKYKYEHCSHFFNLLALFGTNTLPKGYILLDSPVKQSELKGYRYQETWIVDEESLEKQLVDLYKSQLKRSDKKEAYQYKDDVDFHRFVNTRLMMANLDKLNDGEKRFLGDVLRAREENAITLFYSEGSRIPVRTALEVLTKTK